MARCLDRDSPGYDLEFDLSLNVLETVAVESFRLAEIKALADAGLLLPHGDGTFHLRNTDLLRGWMAGTVKRSGSPFTGRGRSGRRLARKVLRSLLREHSKYGSIRLDLWGKPAPRLLTARLGDDVSAEQDRAARDY